MLDVVYLPYHRGLFINGDVHKQLENSLKEVTDHTGGKFQSKVTDGVVKYKKIPISFTKFTTFIKNNGINSNQR